MRRASKVDATHPAIVDALRAAGAYVQSLAMVGGGCPDLLAGYRGMWHVLECKSKGGRFTEDQIKWLREAKGPTHVVYSPEEALRAIGATK